jgi:hypothetical protein
MIAREVAPFVLPVGQISCFQQEFLYALSTRSDDLHNRPSSDYPRLHPMEKSSPPTTADLAQRCGSGGDVHCLCSLATHREFSGFLGRDFLEIEIFLPVFYALPALPLALALKGVPRLQMAGAWLLLVVFYRTFWYT